jgi:murein DD-endopeptidase MepM/ murein hydrolase activator NlpD
MDGLTRAAAHRSSANQSWVIRGANRIFAIAFALSVAVCGATPRGADVALAIGARSLAPGEILVLTVTVGGDPASVRVTLFGKDVSASGLPDGRWEAVAGIDLEQAPGTYTATVTAATKSGPMRHEQELVVAPKQFPTRTLRVSPAFVNPSPAQLAKIKEDSALLKSIFAASASTRLWSSPFVRPVPGDVGGNFGSRSIFNGEPRRPHGGADFRSPAGTPIKAPNAGRIVCARDLFFTGQTVVVDHGVGVFSTLAHLSRLDVTEGATVAAGEIVGLVGSTGRATAPHLHWGVSVAGARVDPLSLLALLGDKN